MVELIASSPSAANVAQTKLAREAGSDESALLTGQLKGLTINLARAAKIMPSSRLGPLRETRPEYQRRYRFVHSFTPGPGRDQGSKGTASQVDCCCT